MAESESDADRPGNWRRDLLLILAGLLCFLLCAGGGVMGKYAFWLRSEARRQAIEAEAKARAAEAAAQAARKEAAAKQ